jgi:hypothetical protein
VRTSAGRPTDEAVLDVCMPQVACCHAARCVCAGVQTPNFVRFFASDCRYSQGMYKAWLRTAAAFRGQVSIAAH